MYQNARVVLFVEADEVWHQQVTEVLTGQSVELLIAYNDHEASWILGERPDIDIVVVSDNIDRRGSDPFEFVKTIREKFKGLIIAFSSNCNVAADMMAAGCDRHVLKSCLVQYLLSDDMCSCGKFC